MISTFKVKRRLKNLNPNIPKEDYHQLDQSAIKDTRSNGVLTSFNEYCERKYRKRPNNISIYNEAIQSFGDELIAQEVDKWNRSSESRFTSNRLNSVSQKRPILNNTFITAQAITGQKESILFPLPSKNQIFIFGDTQAKFTRLKKKQFTSYVQDVVNDTKHARNLADQKAKTTFGQSSMWHKTELNKEVAMYYKNQYFLNSGQGQVFNDIKYRDEQLEELKNIYIQKQSPNTANLRFQSWTKRNLGSVPSHNKCTSMIDKKRTLSQDYLMEELQRQKQRSKNIRKPETSMLKERQSFEAKVSLEYFMRKSKNK